MKVNAFFKNMKNSQALLDQMNERLAKLDKLFSQPVDAMVTFSTLPKDLYKVEAQIGLKGTILRAEVASENMQQSMDRAVEKLERQIRKYRTKFEKRHQPSALRQGEAIPPIPDDFSLVDDALEDSHEPMIVRTKQFEIKPMTEEEAILQMELLDHDFFLFDNHRGQTCLIYRRKDGNYGLIERA